MARNISLYLPILIYSVTQLSCTFNFELTSQRTALENQVLGTYKEIEDELILVSAVRGEMILPKEDSPATMARKNQDFNRDDIEELKSKHLIGETHMGDLKATESLHKMSLPERDLAFVLIKEENENRRTIWARIVTSNKNLSEDDLPEVRKTYAKIIFERSPKGHLFLNEANVWIKK